MGLTAARGRGSHSNMINRCYRKSHRAYRWYGARGIKVCARWRQPMMGFRNFLADMGERPEGATIDRIDTNKGYSKKNCRWSTQEQNCNNRRDNIPIKAFGEIKSPARWSRDRRCRVKECTLRMRLHNGVDPETALTKPSRNRQ